MTFSLLFIITDSGIGGSEKILTELIRGLPKDQISISGVIVLKNKRESAKIWEELGIPVYSFGMSRIPNPLIIFKLRKLIRKINPDVVQAFLYHSIQLTRILKIMGMKFKLITSPRVNYRFLPFWAQWIDRILKDRDQAIVAESESTKNYLVQKLKYPISKVITIVNGVNAPDVKGEMGDRSRFRKQVNVSEEKILMGGMGRLHKQKGFDILISALSGIPKDKYELVIAGDGPEKTSLQKLATENGISIHFLGTYTAKSMFYSGIDIFVLPSRYEGMPNTLMEAMAVGLPCVAAAVDGVDEFSEDGENILLSKPEDEKSLLKAINSLIQDPHLRNHIGENAKKIADRFTIEKMVDGFGNVYKKIIML